MALRYYPSFRTLTNQSTNGGELYLNGQEYVGKYYITYDGRVFSGQSPLTGPNEELTYTPSNIYSPAQNNPQLPQSVKNSMAKSSKTLLPKADIAAVQTNTVIGNTITTPGLVQRTSRNQGAPTPYYPEPTQQDYRKGYIIRYFVKKKNDIGYVIEIDKEQYDSINSGTAKYNISPYQTANILWKITGPLNTQRLSQYDIRAGIIDTNKRLVEQLDTTFFGIKDFIAEDYTKFAVPTS